MQHVIMTIRGTFVVRFEPVAEFNTGIISVKYHSHTDIYYSS